MSDPKVDAKLAFSDERRREIKSRPALKPEKVAEAFDAWNARFGTYIGFAMLSDQDVVKVSEGTMDPGAVNSPSFDHAYRAAIRFDSTDKSGLYSSDPAAVAKLTAERMKTDAGNPDPLRAKVAKDEQEYLDRLKGRMDKGAGAIVLSADMQGREESVDAAAVRRHVSWWTPAQWTTDDGQWEIRVAPSNGARRPMFSNRKDAPARVLVEVYRALDTDEEPMMRRQHPEASIILAKTKHTAQRAVAFYELVAALHTEEAYDVDEQEAQAELRRSERRGQRISQTPPSKVQDAMQDALKDAQAATQSTTDAQAREIGDNR